MSSDELIRQCQQGDKQAFNKLVTRHYDAIYKTAWRWCGNPENAEDITQNACIKLAHNVFNYEFKSSFTTWLYRLTINCAKDYYKSPTQHNKREESADEFNQLQSPKSMSENRLHAQRMLEKISDLPIELAEVLVLVFIDGLSHAQIAKHCAVKESTISWRVHEARKQLKILCEAPSNPTIAFGASL